jgi:CBS-domain-containing membrane protein
MTTARRIRGGPLLDWQAEGEREPVSGVGSVQQVRDVMSWPAAVVAPGDTAASAARLGDQGGFHHFPVVDTGDVIGVVCVCDLWTARPTELVRSCMTVPVITVQSGAAATLAARLMNDHDIDALPTLWLDAWGIVTRGDLVRAGICDEADRPRCFACGGWHHVRPSRTWPDRYGCLECMQAEDGGHAT